MNRRAFVLGSMAAILSSQELSALDFEETAEMYGLIGKIVAKDGKREELARILIDNVGGMPGCLSYVVASDVEDENALWVTEVWESEQSHQESLTLPEVRSAIERGRPLIERFGEGVVTAPLGGHGLG